MLVKKIFHKKSPSYLFQLNPPNNNVYATRSSQSNKILSFKTRHNFFKDSFFPSIISEWNSLDINIWNSSSINVFKKELLKFIRPEPNSTYNINDTKGLKLLTRLRLGPNVFLWSGNWNSTLLPSLPQSSLCKKNAFSQVKSSKWNHLETWWFNNYKDSAIQWQ